MLEVFRSSRSILGDLLYISDGLRQRQNVRLINRASVSFRRQNPSYISRI